MTETVLVTGATGFVGRRLVERLQRDGWPVRSAVRRAAGLPGEVIVGSLGPDTEWAEALSNVTTVIHLAGRAHVTQREADPLPAFRRVNAAGTRRLAEQAHEAGARRFILVSSVKAAGDRSGREPLRENDAPVPDTAYGISKLKGEQALFDIWQTRDAVAIRPPLVYGPGVRANFLALMRMVDAGIPLPFSSVRNARSLIALDNLVDAIIVAMRDPQPIRGTFYVCDGPPLSTPELIRQMAYALGRAPRLVPFPVWLMLGAGRLLGRGDSAESLFGSLVVDDHAFRQRFGWTPPLSQEAAFAAVADWYRRRKGHG